MLRLMFASCLLHRVNTPLLTDAVRPSTSRRPCNAFIGLTARRHGHFLSGNLGAKFGDESSPRGRTPMECRTVT